MGLNEFSPRATYISIANGAIVRRFKTADEDPTAKARTTQTGSTVYERTFRSFDGIITDIKVASSTFEGKTIDKSQWKVSLVDENGELFVLTMNYSSSYAKRFINALANIEDFSVPYRIAPWMMENKEKPGKYWYGVTLYRRPYGQDCKIELRFKKEEVPPLKEVKFKGETKWDDEDQMLFLENAVRDIIMPRIEAARSTVAYNAIGSSDDDHGDAHEPEAVADTPDGLPF